MFSLKGQGNSCRSTGRVGGGGGGGGWERWDVGGCSCERKSKKQDEQSNICLSALKLMKRDETSAEVGKRESVACEMSIQPSVIKQTF